MIKLMNSTLCNWYLWSLFVQVDSILDEVGLAMLRSPSYPVSLLKEINEALLVRVFQGSDSVFVMKYADSL